MPKLPNLSLNKQRLLVFIFPLLLALPFLNRAYFVDDSYFVEISTWLMDNPELPYHFTADDTRVGARGWEEDGFVRMVNPLAHHYYLALLLKIGGENEWFLRLGCVLLVALAGLCLFELCRRWTKHGLLATLLICTTPGWWLTSYSLLIDSTLGAFLVTSLYFFVRGGERGSPFDYLISGVCMGVAILSKYPGVFLFPLTGLWLVLNWKKMKNPVNAFLAWGMGALFLLVYSHWTQELYGAPHILAASKRTLAVFGWAKILVFLVFFGGVSLIPLIVWRFQTAQRNVVLGLVVFIFTLLFSSSWGGFSFVQAFLVSLFFITSLAFIWQFIEKRKKWRWPEDPFVLGWVLGFIVMMFLVMGWVAGRYFVIVLPALGLAVVRLVEWQFERKAAVVLKTLLAATLIFTSLLAYADYKQAAPSRGLGQRLLEDGFSGAPNHYYLGDSFTTSYLKRYGWVPGFHHTSFKPGDLVLTKKVTMPLKWFYRKPLVVQCLATYTYDTHFPLKLMDYEGSAGFYASVWGALPFTFSRGPWERYDLYRVVRVRRPAEKVQ